MSSQNNGNTGSKRGSPSKKSRTGTVISVKSTESSRQKKIEAEQAAVTNKLKIEKENEEVICSLQEEIATIKAQIQGANVIIATCNKRLRDTQNTAEKKEELEGKVDALQHELITLTVNLGQKKTRLASINKMVQREITAIEESTELAKQTAEIHEEEDDNLNNSLTSEESQQKVETWRKRNGEDLQLYAEQREQFTPAIQDSNLTAITALTAAITTAMSSRGGQPNQSSDKFLARQVHGRDLPKFSGKVEEWPLFINSFETSTQDCQYSNADNLIRLQRALEGEAKKQVQCLLISADSVPLAITSLRERFGRPETIIRAMISKARNAPTVQFNKHETWLEFGLAVNNLVATITSIGVIDQLANPSLVEELVAKLPPGFQRKWEMNKLKNALAFAKLSDFATWLQPYIQSTYALCEEQSAKSKQDSSIKQKPKHASSDRVLVVADKSKSKQSRFGEDRKCQFCSEISHTPWKCPKFLELEVNARWEIVKKTKTCCKCLIPGHIGKDCRKANSCSVNGCTRNHNRLLHGEGKKEESPSSTEISQFVTSDGKEIKFLIQPVFVKRKDGKLVDAYIALDSLSSLSSTSNEDAKKLGIRGPSRPLPVQGFQTHSVVQESQVIDLEIVSKVDGKSHVLHQVKTVPNLDLPAQSISKEFLQQYSHLKNLPIQTYSNKVPTILVGLDNPHLHVHHEVSEGRKDEPIGVRTKMGWTVMSAIPEQKNKSKRKELNFTIREEVDSLHNMVKEFFSTEFFGVKPNSMKARSKEDVLAQSIMDKTIRRVDDHWESGLLWRKEDCRLPHSKTVALRRLHSMEKKMDSDPEFAQEYVERIKQYEDKGFARRLTPSEASVTTDKTFFIPHFMAFNVKKSKKWRFVLDAAAKCEGNSLNDFLLQGPDLLVSLPGALMKFRQHKIAIAADIQDMYHRVRIKPDDAPAQRFLFRGMDRVREPDTYQMDVLIFGASCSPACAQEAKNKNAEEFREEFPRAYNAIIKHHYMDDLMTGGDTPEEAVSLQQQITEVHRRGSFKITNWVSNSKEVMSKIPEDLRAKSMECMDIDTEEVTERVLGLFYKPKSDTFTFSLKFLKGKEEVLNLQRMPTKREVLSLFSSVFDCLGFVSTLTVKAKMILQDTWRSGIGWDDEIPDQCHETWRNWVCILKTIETFSIPRCYSAYFTSADNIQLHIFCDASSEAYGAVGYFRIQKGNQIEVSLIMSKSNVCPVKPLTIPRCELQAALMGARLKKFILEQHEYPVNETVMWSDSETFLSWVRSVTAKFNSFVGARVGEIQELTDVREWRWIPTDINVADDLTRSKSEVSWTPDSRWIRGPDFLYGPEEDWPKTRKVAVDQSEDQSEGQPEKEREQVFSIAEATAINLKNFSSFPRLIRVTAYVLRFIHNARPHRKVNLPPLNSKALSLPEIKMAELWWIQKVQEECFPNELKDLSKGKPVFHTSRLYRLNAYCDGVMIRVGGRLDNSSLPIATRRPLILDHKHSFTQLLVSYFHQISRHHGQERIVNEIRQLYHIPHLREAVKKAQTNCPACIVRKAKPTTPLMGQLPAVRVEAGCHPFNKTGLDYFGPLLVGKNSTAKRWFALFTCLQTRAVHLELVSSLSTDACIMALQRFFARRGCPEAIYSDNGKNFQGASNELRSALQELNQQKMTKACAQAGVEWHFIPPAAPHMGGAWESLVKCVKKAMGETLQQKKPLREEVLLTVLAEAEHIVNSRPLVHVPVDPDDEEALTPNHFLIGRSSNLQQLGPSSNNDLFGRKQWKKVQVLQRQFWRRWVKEYLPTLLRRRKWNAPTKPVEVGDIVLLIDNNHPRDKWHLGRVTAAFPGKDGVVRVIEVRINEKFYRRPVHRVCVLDVLQKPDEPESQP